MLGFGGHFSSKSRRYSTTLTALRCARAAFAARRKRRAVALAGRDEEDAKEAGVTVVLATWRYVGSGYRTEGEAWLARSAAAEAREQRRVAHEELSAA
jgi:hypothetical protein